ncbi:MAG: STAS domain-containing protein [Magnetococcales bacterium]|nr:STAS domain-containing protein [Magnetococcales bacterium]
MDGVVTVTLSGRELKISIRGRFNFDTYSQFHEACGRISSKNLRVIVDLSDTEYIDSAGLGMLIFLRSQIDIHESYIEIVNVAPDVRKVLENSNFQRLFKIS